MARDSANAYVRTGAAAMNQIDPAVRGAPTDEPLALGPFRAESRPQHRGSLPTWTYPAAFSLLCIGIWQAYVDLADVKFYVLPAPSAIVRAGIDYLGPLDTAALTTIEETVGGFALAVVVGIPVAGLVVASPLFDKAFSPIIVLINSIPKLALAPLFVVWFGYGSMPKILTAYLICFFPVVLDTATGFRMTDQRLVDLMRSMGATSWDIFAKVRLYKALPSIFAGIKVSASLAVIGAVVAEFVASNSGLGYLLQEANTDLLVSLMFADMIYLSVIGFVLYWLVELVERSVAPWNTAIRRVGQVVE